MNTKTIMAIRHCFSQSWNSRWSSYMSGHQGSSLTPTLVTGCLLAAGQYCVPLYRGCCARLNGKRQKCKGGPSPALTWGCRYKWVWCVHSQSPDPRFPFCDSTFSGGIDAIPAGSGDGLNLHARTASCSQLSFPAALLLSRHLILECCRAFVLWCCPMFPGAFLFALLPGRIVPLDRALSGLTGLFGRRLGWGHIILLWDIRSCLSLLRPSPFRNSFLFPCTLPGSRNPRAGLCRGLFVLERSLV